MPRHNDVPATRRDGLPVPVKRRHPGFTATGGDVGARCTKCGKSLGFIEGGAVISALCNRCSGVPVGSDPWGSTLPGERIRTNLNGG